MKTLIKFLTACSLVLFTSSLFAKERKPLILSISGTVKAVEKDYVEIDKDGKIMKLPKSAFDNAQVLKVGNKVTGKVQAQL